MLCVCMYVWVGNGVYKYAWVFISPEQGLNSVLTKNCQFVATYCVIIGMYGYGMVCISMHEYLLAPCKVWTVPQPISQSFEELPGWNSELKLFTTTYIISVLCKFVAPYWGVTWSVVYYYRYVWVWKGGYKYAWVFISPQQGLNSSPAPPHVHISAVWRATRLKFRT